MKMDSTPHTVEEVESIVLTARYRLMRYARHLISIIFLVCTLAPARIVYRYTPDGTSSPA